MTFALAGIGFTTIAGAQTPPPSGRIVNGTAALPGELPHQVIVMVDGLPLCGGSIVGPSTVVSAAHCFFGPGNYSIRAGVLNLNDTTGQDRVVREVISHPDFASQDAPDVAVLRLATPLNFNSQVGSIGLAAPADIVIGRSAVISGWGAPSELSENYPDFLQRADVVLVDDAACNRALAAEQPGAFIFETLELCASSQPSDSCYGDSGGPLTVGSGAAARLAGVVSWGLECAGPAPGIYAEIPAVAAWIETNAGEVLSGTSAQGPAQPPDGRPTTTPNPPPSVTPPTPGRNTCNGMTVTVNLASGDLPTDGDDVIAGTPGNDMIAAGAGNDVVCGLGGNDTIWGQAGTDVLLGGDGDDRLRGGAGDDDLRGGDGADDLSGGTGDDTVMGEAGNDLRLRGGTGDDTVDGGAGNDLLIAGNGGEDHVTGGDGDDRVTGGPRPDTIEGGAGSDELRGNKGADMLDGGAGDDELFGGPQADQLNGGEGTDACNGGTTVTGGTERDTAIACEGVLVSIP